MPLYDISIKYHGVPEICFYSNHQRTAIVKLNKDGLYFHRPRRYLIFSRYPKVYIQDIVVPGMEIRLSRALLGEKAIQQHIHPMGTAAGSAAGSCPALHNFVRIAGPRLSNNGNFSFFDGEGGMWVVEGEVLLMTAAVLLRTERYDE